MEGLSGLLALFMICSCFITSGGTTCPDASGPIEHGRIDCARDRNAYHCKVTCIPGYVAKDFTYRCSGHPLRDDASWRNHLNERCSRGGPSCPDASGPIEHGRIDCAWDVMGYQCKVTCFPGYVARDFAYRCSTDSSWWNNLDQSCSLPKSCPGASSPRNGRGQCTYGSLNATCKRSCFFPFVPSEEEHETEHCGPETNFFWTYVLRNNATSMPPCVVKDSCDNIETTITRNNGIFNCKVHPKLHTEVCRLNCDIGYLPDNDNKESYCGPSTAFVWSHEYVKKDVDIERIAECKKAPITVEMTLKTQCDASERGNMDRLGFAMKRVLEAELKLPLKILNWHRECVPGPYDYNYTKYHFAMKDLCVEGTCFDACNTLPVSGATKTNHCRKMCTGMGAIMQNVDMLNQMRNLTLSNIAVKLNDAKSTVAQNFPSSFMSMKSFVEESKYEGRAFGDGSPFCKSDNKD